MQGAWGAKATARARGCRHSCKKRRPERAPAFGHCTRDRSGLRRGSANGDRLGLVLAQAALVPAHRRRRGAAFLTRFDLRNVDGLVLLQTLRLPAQPCRAVGGAFPWTCIGAKWTEGG